MKTLLGTLILAIILSLSTNAIAAISLYQSTDNTGLNKQERIENVEDYLAGLSKTLKAMEEKVNDSTKKIASLESSLKNITAERVAEKTVAEKQKADFDELSATVKALQATIRELK